MSRALPPTSAALAPSGLSPEDGSQAKLPAANAEQVGVRKIETVTGDFLTEPGEPFWRIEIDGFCADFDHEQAAINFANVMNARTANNSAFIAEIHDRTPER